MNFGAVVTYTQALALSLFRRPLAYVVTPKGEVGTREPLRLFRWHLVVMGVSLSTLLWAVVHGTGAGSIRFWAALNVAEMGLVIATGSLVPSILRDGLKPRLPSRLSAAARIALPLAVGLTGVVVGARIQTPVEGVDIATVSTPATGDLARPVRRG